MDYTPDMAGMRNITGSDCFPERQTTNSSISRPINESIINYSQRANYMQRMDKRPYSNLDIHTGGSDHIPNYSQSYDDRDKVTKRPIMHSDGSPMSSHSIDFGRNHDNSEHRRTVVHSDNLPLRNGGHSINYSCNPVLSPDTNPESESSRNVNYNRTLDKDQKNVVGPEGMTYADSIYRKLVAAGSDINTSSKSDHIVDNSQTTDKGDDETVCPADNDSISEKSDRKSDAIPTNKTEPIISGGESPSPDKVKNDVQETMDIPLPLPEITFAKNSSSTISEVYTRLRPQQKSKGQSFSGIITNVLASCEKQVFSQTSLVQLILNVCVKIAKIPGCEDYSTEISSVCDQILSETYQNNHQIIDSCKLLSNMEADQPSKKSKKNSRAKKGATKKKTKPEKQVEEWQTLSSSISDSEHDQNNDPDWTISTVEPKEEVDEEPKSKKKKYKGLKEGCKPSQKKKGVFQCSQCPKVLYTRKSFESHQNSHMKVTCEICSAVLQAKCLKRHVMRLHSGVKPFICDICGSAFSDKSGLNLHISIHSSEKPFRCDQCDYACINKARLRHHMVSHSTVRKYQCEDCGARFLRSADLKGHLAVHKDEWPFSCSLCGKKFKTKTRLRRHDVVHTDKYLHQCAVCGKKIRQYSNLKIHMRTHSGEKPYKCDFCGLGFAHNVTRKQHQRMCGKNSHVNSSAGQWNG